MREAREEGGSATGRETETKGENVLTIGGRNSSFLCSIPA